MSSWLPNACVDVAFFIRISKLSLKASLRWFCSPPIWFSYPCSVILYPLVWSWPRSQMMIVCPWSRWLITPSLWVVTSPLRIHKLDFLRSSCLIPKILHFIEDVFEQLSLLVVKLWRWLRASQVVVCWLRSWICWMSFRNVKYFGLQITQLFVLKFQQLVSVFEQSRQNINLVHHPFVNKADC